MTEKDVSFKLDKNLKFWMLEQKIEKAKTYDKKELSGMEKDELMSIAHGVEVELQKEMNELDEKEYKSNLIDLIIKEQEVYKASVWVYQNEREAVVNMKEIIDSKYPEPRTLEDVEKIGKGFNLQEVQIVEDKINLKSVSWLKVFLTSYT